MSDYRPRNSDELRQTFKLAMLLRAKTMLYSLQEFVRNQKGGTDGAYSRLRYLALSYAAELIVKAACLNSLSARSPEELNKNLINLGHDLSNIYKKYRDPLVVVGIDDISVVNPDLRQYCLKTVEGQVLIEDFVVVRYDFYEQISLPDKRGLRLQVQDEVTRIKNETEVLLKIARRMLE